VEEELRLEVVQLRREVARMRRTLERLAVAFDAAGRIARLEEAEDAAWPDPTREKPARVDRRRREWR
jgi:hypothetical protein